MPTNTYVALDTQTLGTTATSVTFSSIPQGYTDLVLVINTFSSGTPTLSGPAFRVGNTTLDTSNSYSYTSLIGNGTSATSSRMGANGYITIGQDSSTTLPAMGIAHFQNYSNTTTNKTILIRNSRSDSQVSARVGLWSNTNAINIITIYSPDNGSGSTPFAVGSTFSLYGIKTANAGLAKATGGTITFDGSGNVIHTFTSSGTFTPLQSLTCDYLVVAGGAAGSVNVGGGGGAGGYLAGSTSVTATGYTVTVGAGGAKATYPTQGGNGSNSVFNSITATGGGTGAVGAFVNSGLSGGSGGGGGSTASASTAGTGNTPSTSPSQGNNGGAGAIAPTNTSGGGGGAGSAGVAGASLLSGNGGSGAASSISGSSLTYAGGGGGGGGTAQSITPGSATDGGAAGGQFADASDAPANRGGGGGGGGVNITNTVGYAASNGGSGIVIIRYAG